MDGRFECYAFPSKKEIMNLWQDFFWEMIWTTFKIAAIGLFVMILALIIVGHLANIGGFQQTEDQPITLGETTFRP
jgi:multisubunit Na+/H+ antiporter MnhB subunit